MNITFTPLAASHFPLLLKWLEEPHVKAWWDQGVKWTPELIREKYADYIKGDKLENGIAKKIKAYIICTNHVPIGYIQIYNAYDFARSEPLSGLPPNLGALDIFIGEEAYLKQSLGSIAISEFLKLYGNNYSYVFTDPDSSNIAAIKCYEKVGFKKIANQGNVSEVRMLKQNKPTIIYLTGKPGVGKYTIAKMLARNYGFIVCDNQLINNPIFELLQYDGYAKIPDFAWESIGRIRAEIFDFLIKKVPENNYVLTNNLYEDDGDRSLYEQVKKMAETRGSLFVPVRFLINQDEHLKRVTNPKRRERWKSIDPQDVYDEATLLSIIHPHLLVLDVSNLSAGKVAKEIIDHIKGLTS